MSPRCDALKPDSFLCDKPATWWALMELNGDKFTLYFCDEHSERIHLGEPVVKCLRIERLPIPPVM